MSRNLHPVTSQPHEMTEQMHEDEKIEFEAALFRVNRTLCFYIFVPDNPSHSMSNSGEYMFEIALSSQVIRLTWTTK